MLSKSDGEKYEDLNDNGCYDFTEDAHTFISAVSLLNNAYGIQMYVLFLRGSKSSKIPNKFLLHPLYGSGKHKSEEWWKGLGNKNYCFSFLFIITHVFFS